MSGSPWWTASEARLVAQLQDLPFVEFLEALNRHAKEHGLRSGGHQPLHFVPQRELPIEQNYEAWIFQTGSVPTRDLAHDRLNAMMWLLYPQTKAALNRLQADEISRRGVQAARGSDSGPARSCPSQPLQSARPNSRWCRQSRVACRR